MTKLRLNREQVHSGSLILVNEANAIKETQTQDMLPSLPGCNKILLNRPASSSLTRALRDLGAEGRIVPVSGYRSLAEQESIFHNSLAENGESFTLKYVALPGHSEHQTGLAIDLGEKQEQIDFIRPAFPYHGICQKFRENAPAYGFIERYPKGKEYLTGIAHEPWHFRYVGFPHSLIITQKNLTLEEYLGELIQREYGQNPLLFFSYRYQIEISYLDAARMESGVELPTHLPVQYSGNNMDGCILTIWREQN